MKNIAIIGPSFSGKSELAKVLSALEPNAAVLNIKNICTYYAIKKGANADLLERDFSASDISEAVDDYLLSHNVQKGTTLIWDGISKNNLEAAMLSTGFCSNTVVFVIDKFVNGEIIQESTRCEIVKMLNDNNVKWIHLVFEDNRLSLPNIFS